MGFDACDIQKPSFFAKGPARRTSVLGYRKLQRERNTWLNVLNITCDTMHLSRTAK